MKLDTPRSRGVTAETLAAAYLEGRGLVIVARNYRCRLGEIDLIAREGSTLVFVEVRLRTPSAFGDAAASITRRKQKSLTAAAAHYLSASDTQRACRFDAILLDRLDTMAIEWLRDIIIE